MGEAGPSGQGEGGVVNQFEFGVDPSLDPELAMVCSPVGLVLMLGLTQIPQALRMSMEEEQARQAAATQPTAAPVPVLEPPTPKATVPAPVPETVPADPTDEEETAMLREALAMSEADDVHMEEGGGDDDDEEEAIQRAIAMSMQKEEKEEKEKS